MPTDLPLHPDVLSLYGASLRPPPSTVFDAGVATTFTLDIETALTIPVTLALFACEDREDLLKNPLALLEGLERTADRLAIFCEAGRIQALPAAQSRLCTLLERLIFEVTAPHGGSFHPKLWVLRYRPLEANEPIQIRLLVLSRNLTRDRSWDISLCLDGKVGRRQHSVNRPFVDFLRLLPSLATRTAPERANQLVGELAEDLHRTEWMLPDQFENVSFAVNGTKLRRRWTSTTCKKLGVVSPFCDDGALKMLADCSDEPPLLVGRSDELIAVSPRVLDRFSKISVMDELAETEDGESDDGDDAVRPLSGLHAKVFVQEMGWDTTITVGSGNATRPALLTGKNVEVFATLTGKRSKIGGVTDIFGTDGFGRVLRAFQPGEIPERDVSLRDAEQRIERARRELAGAGLVLRCSAQKDVQDGQQLWKVMLHPACSMQLDDLASATCWMITRGETHACDVLSSLREGASVQIGTLPLVDVTRFVAFRLTDTIHKEASILFTLNLEVSGLPTTRHQAVLRWMLDGNEAFLRYLRLLLADLGDPLSVQFAVRSAEAGGCWTKPADDEPILEDMVRALSHDHDRLNAIYRLMERLENIPGDDGTTVVPKDFIELWVAFRSILDEGDRTDA